MVKDSFLRTITEGNFAEDNIRPQLPFNEVIIRRYLRMIKASKQLLTALEEFKPEFISFRLAQGFFEKGLQAGVKISPTCDQIDSPHS